MNYNTEQRYDDDPRMSGKDDPTPMFDTPRADIPAHIRQALISLHYFDVYAVGDGYQVERFGRAGALAQALEALGFEVSDAVDDRMDGAVFCYAMFREREG